MRHFLLTILLIISGMYARGQNYRFFSSDHDISSSLVNSIYQDHYGMIWISTEDGLNRYDGTKFTIYRNVIGDSTSLAHNFVNSVREDSKGHIYVCSQKGVQLYNPDTDTFTHTSRREGNTEMKYAFSDILELRDGRVWAIGTFPTEITRIGPDGMWMRRLFSNDLDIRGIGGCIEDAEGNIWLMNGWNGVYRMDRVGKIHHYDSRSMDLDLHKISCGPDGTLYVWGNTRGLYRYDRGSDTFVPVARQLLSQLLIKDLYFDNDRTIYIATDGQGLKKFDPAAMTLSDEPMTSSDLSPGYRKVHDVMRDKEGNLWFSVYQKGVVMVPGHHNNFKYVGHRSSSRNTIGSNCVTGICRDEDGTVWLATDNDGIYGIDPQGNRTAHFNDTDTPLTALTLFADSQGRMWVGTFVNGSMLMDRASGRFSAVRFAPLGKRRKVQHSPAFAEGPDGVVWIGTMGSGLFKYDPSANEAVAFESAIGTIDNWICSMYYSRRTNSLYLGTYNGVDIVEDPLGTPRYTHHSHGLIVHGIAESESGHIWFATANGLHRLTPGTDEIKVYTTLDGMSGNTVYAVEADGDALWISSNTGISKMDIGQERFTNFYVNDGLQGNEFYKNSSFRAKDGTMYFGGINGLTYFTPSDIITSGRKLNVRVTDFILNGTPVRAGMKSGGRDIIDSPVFEAREFRLAHSDNSFQIEFGTRELDRPEAARYRYSLDDEPWTELPYGTDMVAFSELNSGRHTLRVVAVDNGIESDPTEIHIDIAPPWYATWWAILLWTGLLLLVCLYAYRAVLLRIRRRKELEERRHEEEMNETRLQFYINMSHEIRTPMSLVLSPLQKLMVSDSDPARLREYRLITRNAKRVLRLVNEMMDISKIDKNLMRISFREIEIVPFIKDLRDTFHQATSSRDIAVDLLHEGCDGLKLWIDRSNFDKVLMNLLSNAVKHTPDGGRITIQVTTGHDPAARAPLTDYAEISVTDTGAGIPPEAREKIFERFFSGNDAVDGSKGTGVGLHLTRSLVKLHHGTITVDGNPDGQGSRFTVRLPLGCAHLNDSDKATDETPATDSAPLELPHADTAPAAAPDMAESKHTRSARVLIAEDNEEIRHYIASELSPYFHVTACRDGSEAIDEIFRNAPDIVISDVMMPQVDGLTLTSRIKRNINLNHIPVILLTAKTRDEDTMQGLEIGADAYMTKPFNIMLLRKTVENLLRSHRRLRNSFSGNQTHDDKVEHVEADSSDDKLMKRVMKVINRNLDNPDITIESVASEVGLSRVHLHRKLKELTNQSPRDFIRNVRLREAAKLLTERGLSVQEVADLTGFRSPNHFATRFKELFGMAPTAYAEANRTPRPEPEDNMS